jgi:Ca2+-binding EF-hand superfamily protein
MIGDDEIDDAIFRKMFDKFDNDGSGLISKDELRISVRELNPKITKEELDEIIGNALFNEAGQLTYENFVDIVKK